MLFVDDSDAIGIYDVKESVLYEKYTKKVEQKILLAVVENEPEKVKTIIDELFRCGPAKPKLSEVQVILKNITEQSLQN